MGQKNDLPSLLQQIDALKQPGEMSRRIELCRQALAQIDCAKDPELWADLQIWSGNSLAQNPLENREENQEQAIVAYEIALQVYTQQDFPMRWAMTQNNLANIYRERIWGDRSENLERAIAAYELALQVYTRQNFPVDWALTQNNLAIAYWQRIQGDRAENLERAIAAYELALHVRTRQDFPVDWAMTQNNLAIAYSQRIQGDRAENLELAIAAYTSALTVYTRENFPEKWAMTQGNLAGALRERWELAGEETDLDQAIFLRQEALTVAVPGSPDFINQQYALGGALLSRYELTQQREDLEQAVQAYETAFQYLSPEHYDRQRFWQAIPETQVIMGTRLVSEGNWQEGLDLLLNSLNQLRQNGDLAAHATALYQTARAYEALSDLDAARLYYRDALRVYEHIENTSGMAKSRAGLGSVLISQGHFEKGLAELAIAQQQFHNLGQTEQAAEVEALAELAHQSLSQFQREIVP